MDKTTATLSFQGLKEMSRKEEELRQRNLTIKQENADLARETSKIERVSHPTHQDRVPIEECEKELKKMKAQAVEVERQLEVARGQEAEAEQQLEVARLIGAQQQLKNLDMQMKINLMRMGSMQLVSSSHFFFWWLTSFDLLGKGLGRQVGK